MRHVLAALVVTLVTGVIMAAEPPVSPKPVNVPALAEGEKAFPVKDGEATVNGDLIKRFAVGAKAVTANYQNKSAQRMCPQYTIELYNKYGLLLGEDTTGTFPRPFGGPGYIDPGDVGSEELHVTWYPLDRILAKSTVAMPEEWQTVSWIVIKNNNPKTLGAKKP